MRRITQRDVVETILGLERVAADLKSAASSPSLPEFETPTVPVQVAGLLGHAEFLSQAARELQNLIPDRAVGIPPRD